jgi:flagellar biosynthesis/type III secretory pathway ATPase
MAWREIGLAVGEPPATKGYPPSVFAMLPRLLERAGNGDRGGITGIYTVLVEGDDFNEPVADHVRSVLDGHVVLSRRLASAGHYPAIEVTDSVSRIRDQIISTDQREAANEVLSLVAAYREKEDLISVGAYHAGSDPVVDNAIRLRSGINDFLRQKPTEAADFGEIRERLLALAEAAHGGSR